MTSRSRSSCWSGWCDVPAVVALIVGALIYILLRDDSIYLVQIVNRSLPANAETSLSNLRSILRQPSLPPHATAWIAVWSLPQALWAFAYLRTSLLVVESNRGRLLAGSFATVAVLSIEPLQAAGLLPGSGCVADFATIAVACLLAGITWHAGSERRETACLSGRNEP